MVLKSKTDTHKGEDEEDVMPLYEVRVIETVVRVYKISARTAEDATFQYWNGGDYRIPDDESLVKREVDSVVGSPR